MNFRRVCVFAMVATIVMLTTVVVLPASDSTTFTLVNAQAAPGRGAPVRADVASVPGNPIQSAAATLAASNFDVPPSGPAPDHLTHPCGGLAPEPAFYGLSPLAIAYVPGMCSSGYGDIGVWQAGGHSYVVQSGFSQRMFHLWNVDNPYSPVALATQSFPSGGTTSTSAFPFKQGNSYYISITMRGSGTGCGFFVYNVTDPVNPVFVARKQGSDWCTPHEHFVSTDANGDADYAWLAMGGESGSGYKAVVLDIHDLANIVETGRYQRPDANSGNYVHDITVIGNRVFLAHWGGGVIVHDKDTLAHNINPTPLNPIDSIRPAGFNVHHSWPTTDGNHLFIEDEFINSPSVEKVRLYNIANIAAPFYETGIIGADSAASSQAHNLKIQNISPGLDRLYVGWYKAGTRGFEVDTTQSPPVITATIKHQLTVSAGSGFGGAWGVDYLPCTLHNQPHTCVYTSDYSKYGLVVDALGYDASLDPYAPESQVTDPTNGQTITTCSYLIQGNAHDYYSGLVQVEVSTDNGLTWSAAQGTGNWTYQWSIPADGAYAIKSRATDLAGNVEAPTVVVNVTVAGSCGAATPSATPAGTATQLATSTTTPTTTSTATRSATSTTTSTATTVASTAIPTATPLPPSSTVPPSTSTAGGATSTATLAASSPTACPLQFTDVPNGSTFYPYIRCLACRGIVGGYDDHTFRPNNNVTRGQLSKIVSNSAGFSETHTTQDFEDVPVGSTFYIYIERLVSRNIIGGYPCGGVGEPCGPGNRPYFRPNANATRGQITKIDANAANYNDPPVGQQFQDVPVGSTFYNYTYQLVTRGIMSGYPCGGAGEPCGPSNLPYFRPNNNATRGQTSKIVANTFYPACDTPARQ